MSSSNYNLSGAKFPVTLRVVHNEHTGEEFIIRTDEELDEILIQSDGSAEKSAEVRRMMGGEERIVKMEMEREKAFAKVTIDKERESRDKVISIAVQHQYTLIRPTYGEHLEAEEIANEVDPRTFESRFNQSKYINYLFPKSIEGMKPDEVKQLSPAVGRNLRDKLMASIFPSPDRVLFTLSR